MSALCERMIQDMQLRGLSLRTQVSYTRAIRQLAKHYHKAPDLITQEELRDYFLYRKNVSRWSSSASTITLCAIKFLYDNTLKKDFSIAITNHRLISMDESHVTIKYKDHNTDQWMTERLEGVQFLRRFLFHVLPKGFHKVRYYGLWHPCKKRLASPGPPAA